MKSFCEKYGVIIIALIIFVVIVSLFFTKKKQPVTVKEVKGPGEKSYIGDVFGGGAPRNLYGNEGGYVGDMFGGGIPRNI